MRSDLLQEGPVKEAATEAAEATILRAVQSTKGKDSAELWGLATRTLHELGRNLQPLTECLVTRISESRKGPLQVG